MLCNTALLVISACSYRVHHGFLYAATQCPYLYVLRPSQWMAFIYKSITGLLPTYLSLHRWCPCSQDIIQIQVTRGRTELGKKAFKFSSWTIWNDVKRDFRLTNMVEKCNAIIRSSKLSSIRSSFVCCVFAATLSVFLFASFFVLSGQIFRTPLKSRYYIIWTYYCLTHVAPFCSQQIKQNDHHGYFDANSCKLVLLNHNLHLCALGV